MEQHKKETGSKLAEKLLSNFEENLASFKKIIPNDYKKMMDGIASAEKQGLPHEQAVMSAFNAIVGK